MKGLKMDETKTFEESNSQIETAETDSRFEDKKTNSPLGQLSPLEQFTEEQLKYMQSEIDRRVTSAHNKWDSKMKDEINEREESVRSEEREKSEREKAELSSVIQKTESENKILKNKFRCIAEMEKLGIPATFVDMIACEDTDETDMRLKNFTDTFKSAVRDEVSKKIASPNPKSGKSVPSISKKDFREMTLSEQQTLKDTNKELYNELIKNI